MLKIAVHFEETLMASELQFAWSGDYGSLKQFFSVDLNLPKTWKQPGRNKKAFETCETVISWRKSKNMLTIEGVEVSIWE